MISYRVVYRCSLAFLSVLCCAHSAWAESCQATSTRYAMWLTGADPQSLAADWLTRLTRPDTESFPEPAEIYGSNTYRKVLDNGWILMFLPQQAGWSLRIYDKEPDLGGVDLTSITPPFSGSSPNTRDVFGWHFRNRANTATNTGDVNAPQHFRPFAFSTSLIGTGGFKPGTNSDEPGFLQPDAEGRGWLKILDFGLADLEEGQQARMNYLKFEGCITWPKSAQVISDERLMTTHEYVDPEIEKFGRCGLDLDVYQLNARILPRSVSGDFDGDGALDELIQVTERSGRGHDLALCRAGTWIHSLRSIDDKDDFQHTLSALESWRVVPADFAKPGAHGGEARWPDADGDVLVLERIEKTMYLVFMENGVLQTRRVYRYVEP